MRNERAQELINSTNKNNFLTFRTKNSSNGGTITPLKKIIILIKEMLDPKETSDSYINGQTIVKVCKYELVNTNNEIKSRA